MPPRKFGYGRNVPWLNILINNGILQCRCGSSEWREYITGFKVRHAANKWLYFIILILTWQTANQCTSTTTISLCNSAV